MKHISSFHGSITAFLTRSGYRSSAVLQACNAWRGSQKGEEAKSTGKVSLSGKVTEKGKDNRKLTVTDNVTHKAEKLAYSAPGALIALSEELEKVQAKHGVSIELAQLPQEIAVWLDRPTFAMDYEPEGKPEEKQEPETEKQEA